MSVVVVNHVSLDGVLQAPGRPDEDTRDGFVHGGWALAGMTGTDPVIGAAMGARMGNDFAWLFGRRSYDDMLTYWNEAGGPFKDGLNGTRKFVVSRDPGAELPWLNSTLVSGDVPREIARLRDESAGNLVIMGSGELIRTLLPHGLVDVLLLFVHPVVLGSGARLFGADEDAHRWHLLDSDASESGVIVTSYEAPR